MKIALLTDGITPYVIGGMQRHSFYLAKYLVKNNIDIDLYHTNQSDFDIGQLNCFTPEEQSRINSVVVEFPKSIPLPGHYIRNSYKYSVEIFNQFLKYRDVDFIYAKGFTAWKFLEEKKKGMKLAPIGINFHGLEMFQKPSTLKNFLENYFILRRPTKKNIQSADFLFSYGGKISGILNEQGVQAERIIEVPTGIDSSMIAPNIKSSNGQIKFLFIGRYERRKGIEELNKVIKFFLKSEASKFQFNFIGPIPNNKKIIHKNVIYNGVIKEIFKLKELIRSCDVLVCPSYAEGMPNVIVEGMAGGLAIVASNVGAVSCLVNSENGWLISPGNTNELKGVFKNVLNLSCSDLNKKKEISLFKIKDEFLWDNIIIKLIENLKKRIN